MKDEIQLIKPIEPQYDQQIDVFLAKLWLLKS